MVKENNVMIIITIIIPKTENNANNNNKIMLTSKEYLFIQLIFRLLKLFRKNKGLLFS
jgi:hypothetical protein